MNDDMIRMMEGDGEGVDLFAQLLAQAKDDGLQDRLDDLRDKGKVWVGSVAKIYDLRGTCM